MFRLCRSLSQLCFVVGKPPSQTPNYVTQRTDRVVRTVV
jgi:hypothetical protein